MNSQDFRALHEAYLDVYNQEEYLGEGIGSAIRGLFGKKKEAETPQPPQSRGAQLRQRYNVGPEKSDTSAKMKILNRAKENVGRAQTQVNRGNASQSYADKAKKSHDSYLRAGYSKYGADDARGSGNKARKRAAALNREEFEFWVNSLVEEGYNLSEYTWDDMYDIYLDEKVLGAGPGQREAAAAERRSGIKPLSVKKGKQYADFTMSKLAYVKRKRDEIDEGMTIQDYKKNKSALKQKEKRAADKLSPTRRAGIHNPEKKPERDARRDAAYGETGHGGPLRPNKVRKAKALGELGEGFDLYDIILSHLLDEGYAETSEAAERILMNMSKDWIGSIMKEEDSKKPKMMYSKNPKYARPQKDDANAKSGGSKVRTHDKDWDED